MKIQNISTIILLVIVCINTKAQNANYKAAKAFYEQQKDYKNAKIEIDKVAIDTDSIIELENNYLRLEIYAALLKQYSLQKDFEINEFIKQLNYTYQLAEKSKKRIGFNFCLQNIAQVHLNKLYDYLIANKLTETKMLLSIAETAYTWHEYDKSPTSKYLMNAFDHYFVFYKSWMQFKNNDLINAKITIEKVSFSEFLKKDAEYFDYLIDLYKKVEPSKLNSIYLEATTYQPKKIKYYKLYFDNELSKGYSKSSIFNVVKSESIKNFPDSLVLYEKILQYYMSANNTDLYYSNAVSAALEFSYTATEKFPFNNRLKYWRMVSFMNQIELQKKEYEKNKSDQELFDALQYRIEKAKAYFVTLKSSQSFLQMLNKEKRENFESFNNKLK